VGFDFSVFRGSVGYGFLVLLGYPFRELTVESCWEADQWRVPVMETSWL